MDYDLALLIVALAVLFFSVSLLAGEGPDASVGTPTPTPGTGAVTDSATGSPDTASTPDPTASPTATPPGSTGTQAPTATIRTRSPTPTPTPRANSMTSPAPSISAGSPTRSPTSTEGWPRAEFWHECDSKRSADIYYRIEVLGTQQVTELYGADDWESNFPRTFSVSGTETRERSLTISGGRWIELYAGENTDGDPFARYYVEEDACRDDP